MSSEAKTTKGMILSTVLDIMREAGFEPVNVRSISGKLQCSTRPIFTCYENMGELKKELLGYAYEFYGQYVEGFSGSKNINPCLVPSVSYTGFAKEETHLFRLLFINHIELSMEEPKDFYKEANNEKRGRVPSNVVGAEPRPVKAIFIDLLPYSHGIAILATTQKITLDRNHVEKVAVNVLTALIRQEKPDWTLSL